MTFDEIREYIAEHKTAEIKKTTTLTFTPDGKICGEYAVSEICVFLLGQAARWCNHYVEDITYDLPTIKKKIDSTAIASRTGGTASDTMFFGFRDCGEDHRAFVECRLAEPACYGDIHKCYKSLFAADITATYVAEEDSAEIIIHLYGYEDEENPFTPEDMVRMADNYVLLVKALAFTDCYVAKVEKLAENMKEAAEAWKKSLEE